MDIHRCRFVPYPPSTINALAFSHSHIARGKGDNVPLRLAIGRANGDIEIWNPLNGAWFQETILRGGEDRSVDGLVWTQDPDEEDADGKIIVGKLRLFSIGYTTTVTEWDLERGEPLRQSSGNHGEIWCIAAQPHMEQGKKLMNGNAQSWTGQDLVVGCTDGAIVRYSTADGDLKLERVLVRPSAKRAKVISIGFQSRDVVVAGCTDSTIRVYDIRGNGQSIRSISLGAGPQGGPKEIIVWAVKCLPNGNIVSGDSAGELRIWDGKTYTLIQRIKSHRQDILSLATSVDGSTIMSGGMDRRTVVYKQTGGAKPRWAEVTHKRFHGHDVKTMATFEGKGMSIVVSGGPDATPVVLPLREFGMENQRMLPGLPQEPIVQSSPSQRLVVSYWDREVHVWRINNKKPVEPKETAESGSEPEQNLKIRKLVAKVFLKGEANITSVSISANGSLLAVSTNNEIKMFRLKLRADGDSLRVSKLDVPQTLASGGARLVQFSPDTRWITVVRRDNKIAMARILGDATKTNAPLRLLPQFAKLTRLDRNIEKRVTLGGLGSYERTISKVAFSSDSHILAVSDLAGYIDTWVLKGEEELNDSQDDDSVVDDSDSDESGDESEKKSAVRGQSWTRNPSASSLPKLPAAAVVLSFRPATASTTEDRLLVVTANSNIFEFNVLEGGLTKWSRSNPTTKFPEEFRGVIDQAMGCLWDVSESRERLWVYGTKWMFMFDLSRDFPAQQDMRSSRKRKHAASAQGIVRNKGTGGAGSKIADNELSTGMSRKMQRVTFEETNETHEFDLRKNGHKNAAEEDDEAEGMDLDEDKATALERLRRGTVVVANGTSNEGDDSKKNSSPHWWHTYKYRPIMGIVALEGGDSSSGLEVVLVERPEWELDLPPRYYGDQEWEKPGL